MLNKIRKQDLRKHFHQTREHVTFAEKVGRIGGTEANNTRAKTTCPPYYLENVTFAEQVGRIGGTEANNTRAKTTCPPYYLLMRIGLTLTPYITD